MNHLGPWQVMQASWKGQYLSVCIQKRVLNYFVMILSLLPISSAASSTPAVNIQPDVSGGWDWHTKPGKSQQVIFVHI